VVEALVFVAALEEVVSVVLGALSAAVFAEEVFVFGEGAVAEVLVLAVVSEKRGFVAAAVIEGALAADHEQTIQVEIGGKRTF